LAKSQTFTNTDCADAVHVSYVISTASYTCSQLLLYSGIVRYAEGSCYTPHRPEKITSPIWLKIGSLWSFGL